MQSNVSQQATYDKRDNFPSSNCNSTIGENPLSPPQLDIHTHISDSTFNKSVVHAMVARSTQTEYSRIVGPLRSALRNPSTLTMILVREEVNKIERVKVETNQ